MSIGPPRTGRTAVAAAVLVLVAACSSTASQAPPGAAPATPTRAATATGVPDRAPSSASAVTIVAAGDIGACGQSAVAATGALLRRELGRDQGALFLALGDIAYPDGSAGHYAQCYDPAFGFARARTLPVPGNHDHQSAGAGPYFDYFGPSAGQPPHAWRSLDVGAWHVVALDSSCDDPSVGGCGPGSEQYSWLRADLSMRRPGCLLAYWHHPRWSSGSVHGPYAGTAPLYGLLEEGGADLLLTGHEHNYERFARLSAAGEESAKGIREIVVGTGGAEIYHDLGGPPARGSQVRYDAGHGLIRLALSDNGYSWSFVGTDDQLDSGVDSGSDTC